LAYAVTLNVKFLFFCFFSVHESKTDSSFKKRVTMDINTNFSRDVDNLLQNEEFIKWRLFRTEELEEYWENFRKENPHNEDVLQEAISRFEAVKINYYPISDTEKKDIFGEVTYRIKQHKRHLWMLRAGSVAAVLVMGLLSVIFVKEMKNNARHAIPDNPAMIVGKTLPEEEICLITAGKKTQLPHNAHIGVAEGGKATITFGTDTKKEIELAQTEMSRLVVPYGKRTYMKLSDGTEVWLNSGTQLDFPSEFRGKRREIFVDGEIYIEVAHNSKIPFIVHAHDMDIMVEGTAFNITAYKEDNRKTVVLVEGKVKIEAGDGYRDELRPNEKIEIFEHAVSKETVNVSEYIGWKDGILEFNSAPMSEILKKVGRYYNVQFDETSALNDQTFSGKLFLSGHLDSVMTSISILSSTEYERENNTIRIRKKTAMPMK